MRVGRNRRFKGMETGMTIVEMCAIVELAMVAYRLVAEDTRGMFASWTVQYIATIFGGIVAIIGLLI